MKWDNRSAFSRAPEGFHNRLVQTLSHLPEQKECLSMEKKRTWKRPAVLAAAAIAVLGTTVFAAVALHGGFWNSHSYKSAVFTEAPNQAQMEQYLETAPATLPQTLGDGYEFQQTYQVSNEYTPEDGIDATDFTSLSSDYQNGLDCLILIVFDQVDTMEMGYGTQIGAVDGVAIYRSQYTSVFLPVNYTMTEEEQAQVDAIEGEVAYGYGADEMEIQPWDSIYFIADGIVYQLGGSVTGLTEADWLEMAEDLISCR